MTVLRILLAIFVLMIISVILQLVTVPFSAVHNTFELMESASRSFRGVILGVLIWVTIRLVKGEQKTPEVSLFIFCIAVIYLVGRAIYDLLA